MMELYAVECFVKVEQEGPSDFFFEAVGVGDDANTVGDPTAQEILPDVVQENHNQLHPEVDCDEVHGAGVEVDDDNLPTPENIPTPNEEVQSVTGDWEQGIEISPPIGKLQWGSSLTLLQFFKQLFPIMFLKDVSIANINKVIKGEWVKYGEMDKFWCVQRLIDAWNENMNENFQPGWITYLDESMLTWTNKFTCPGFMFVP